MAGSPETVKHFLNELHEQLRPVVREEYYEIEKFKVCLLFCLFVCMFDCSFVCFECLFVFIFLSLNSYFINTVMSVVYIIS